MHPQRASGPARLSRGLCAPVASKPRSPFIPALRAASRRVRGAGDRNRAGSPGDPQTLARARGHRRSLRAPAGDEPLRAAFLEREFENRAGHIEAHGRDFPRRKTPHPVFRDPARPAPTARTTERDVHTPSAPDRVPKRRLARREIQRYPVSTPRPSVLHDAPALTQSRNDNAPRRRSRAVPRATEIPATPFARTALERTAVRYSLDDVSKSN